MQLATHNNATSTRAETVPVGAKISGFFKKLFAHKNGNGVADDLAEAVKKARATSAAAGAGASSRSVPPPKPAVVTGPKISASGISRPAVATVKFSLRKIIERFPDELKYAVRKMPSDHIFVEVPRAKIENQLARGAVKIPFAELRALVADGFFTNDTSRDSTAIALPLEDCLRQIKPTRRADQKPTALPSEIAPIFQRAKTEAPKTNPWFSVPAPTLREHVEAAAAAPAAKQPASVAAMVAPQPPVQDALPSPHCLDIEVAALAPHLPEDVRKNLGLENLAHAMLSVPMPLLEPMVKKGKILFEWKHLHSWLRAAAPVPLECEAIVELPLPVIVPLFLARKSATTVRKRLFVDASIPDVFKKAAPVAVGPSPQPGENPAAPFPAPESAQNRAQSFSPDPAPPAATPLPVPAAGSKRAHWLPDEIVSHACEIESVAGAFIATHDGLLVAGHTPGLNERTVAAFAPTLFAQVKAYAQVTGLGEAQSVVVNLGDRAVQIFRCDKLYFGAFNRPGQPMPAAKLAKVAAQLLPQ